MTMKGKITTTEEAAVHVKELDTLIAVHLLEDSTTVLALGRSCEEHGYSYEWIENNTHVNPIWKLLHFNSEISVPNVVPGVIVDTRPRSSADPASGDREQGVTDWLQPVRARTGGWRLGITQQCW